MRVRHGGDRRRRWLVPEVVQTSAMDCGPAALAALCAGFGLPASYGRLREACQTGVDGTSIDTIEDVANGLGLDAAQVMLPVDQLLDPDAAALPAIVVTRLPNGFTHFVVAWRRHGPLVQVMDPAVGRRFLSKRRFLADCHVHAMPVPADAWRRFASSESSLRILGRRLARLGVGDADRRVAHALADPGWRGLATLDAGVRVVTAVAGAGLRRGDHTGALVARLVDEADRIAPPWWSATPAGRDPDPPPSRPLPPQPAHVGHG